MSRHEIKTHKDYLREIEYRHRNGSKDGTKGTAPAPAQSLYAQQRHGNGFVHSRPANDEELEVVFDAGYRFPNRGVVMIEGDEEIDARDNKEEEQKKEKHTGHGNGKGKRGKKKR